MAEHELVIRNGIVVDGTGDERFVGDVAVSDGVITHVGGSGRGRVDGRGHREIDADGHLVAPGFVDIHTHYDGQATWDPVLDPSASHGVTTVVAGNCGVGFAPVRPGQENWLVELMEGVEDIPGTALHEGIQWEWESFPEYLETLSATPTACDFAVLLPHVPLRVYTMGDRCDAAPTQADLDAMRRLVGEAMAVKAAGLAQKLGQL